MAKHIIGKGKVSKGIHTSSRPLKKESVIATIANTFNTNMRNAFINAKVDATVIGSKMVASVVNAASSNLGVHKVGRGWSANLSQRTLKQLTKEGVFA